MAEFQETCKQWKRMCIDMDGTDPYEKCGRCPLGEEHICSFEISDILDDELQRIEEKVMAWAAEHPEPVYPTWAEWLTEMGVAEIGSGMLGIQPAIAEQPIPADIAEKLGIQPKEE